MGFKSEQFVKRVDENLHCPICHEVFKDPVSCKNGHAFCSVCIREWLKTNNRCPSDNTTLKEESLVRLLTVAGVIDNLEVYCHPPDADNDEPTTKKFKLVETEEFLVQEVLETTGISTCDWTGKLQDLTKHKETCPFQLVRCPHLSCYQEMQRREIEKHKVACRFKDVECEECGCEIIQIFLQNHKVYECPEALVPCTENCYTNGEVTKIKRMAMTDHLSNDCGEVSIPCPYEDQGCSDQVLRKDIDLHLQKNMSSHMLLLAKQNNLLAKQNALLSKQTTRLHTKLVDQNVKLKDELQTMKENLGKLKDELSSSYIWIINDYPSKSKKHPKGSHFRSPAFWLCGHRWYLKLYPNGDDTEGFMSLYLCLCDQDASLHSHPSVIPNSEVSVSCRLSVISHKPGTNDILSTGNHVYSSTRSTSWGWPRFMVKDSALSPLYINKTNRSLTIKCTIKLVIPQ